jgi:uncharacterized protein (TIGR03437 family)
MTSERSSVAPRAWGFRAISAIAIIATSFVLCRPRACEALEAKHLSAPLSFEPNRGQTDSAVQFLTRGSGYALFLTPGQIVLNLERQQPKSAAAAGHAPQAASVDTLRMSLVGANPKAPAVGVARQTGVVSYFFGNDPKQWRTGIPTYGKVDYAEVYPGVDLVFYGNQRELEYDFVVAPGADPGRIAWRIDGARPSVDAKGDLTLSASHGSATFRKPVVYQMSGDRKAYVEGAFLVAGGQVGFRLGSYDRSKPLVIDPVLSYVTYLAGSSADYIGQYTAPLVNSTSQGLAVDAAGSVYVTGRTTSVDFPIKNAYQGAQAKGSNSSVFVTKFSPDGSSLVYSTYLAGIGSDYADAIAVDPSGSAYITGNTNSANFPVTNGAYQTLCSPSPSTPPGTVTKASCNGSQNSAFVTKLNPGGTGLVYSTFLGGFGGSEGTAIAVDSAGRAYIAGNENAPCNLSYTFPACFPTTAGATIATVNAQNGTWAFAAVFDPAGANLLYSTLFGDLNGLKGSSTTTFGFVSATGMAVDSNGYFYLIGDTKAGKLPTTLGAFQSASAPLDTSSSFVQAFRGFVAKFNPLASISAGSLAACTYLGGKTGNTSDYLNGIAIDSSGNIYVVGYTNSTDFPVTSGAFNTVCAQAGSCDVGHVTKFNPSLTSAIWSTYIGGSRQDGSDDMVFTGPIQLDGKNNVYITGVAGPQFPLLNPVEPSPSGSGGQPGLVVVELDPTGSNLLFSTPIGSGRLDSMTAGGLAVTSAGVIYVAGNDIGANLITTPGAFQTTDPSPVPTCCYHGFIAKIMPTTAPQITVTGTGVAVYNAATFQAGGIAPNEFISLTGAGLGPATGVSSGMTTQLSGTSVSIGGTAAYLTYAQDGQINALVPFRVSGLLNTTIQVQYNGQPGNTVTVPVVPSSPGIFTQSYGPGQAWIANQDGTFNSASNPAARGSSVAFWVTGQGLVNTTLADGTQPAGPPYPSPLLPVSVSLGGVAVPAANLAFDGLVYSGEVQINLLIPANAPTGNAVPLVVTIGGASSRSDATIAIK